MDRSGDDITSVTVPWGWASRVSSLPLTPAMALSVRPLCETYLFAVSFPCVGCVCSEHVLANDRRFPRQRKGRFSRRACVFSPVVHACLPQLVLQKAHHKTFSARLLVPAPGNIYVTPLRFNLGGRPVLSAHLNVETAGSERKRPEI
jgi:hypothetical protein